MKRSVYLRITLNLFLIVSLLAPTAALAGGDGKKHFRAGMKHEHAEQWDQAAEAFALAVADSPKNPEYRLHLQRALFNASQMYMKKGNIAAAEKDYEGAYIAFRKAYAFDPVNELAKSEMARMLRLQQEAQGAKPDEPRSVDNGKVRLVQTGYNTSVPAPDIAVPQKLEIIRHVNYPSGVNLITLVKELAKDLDLNVLFDVDSRLDSRQVKIDLKNVTAAKALDYLFLQENLFFQRVGPRTILVALSNRRMNFQQLVLRTFYLANASPADVKAIIASAIPPQPGRTQTVVLEDKSTNSITVRDTSENIRLIGRLIESLDKDRAEVVMDVAIYEVNKSDLMQFGNQLGTSGQLTNIGGAQLPFVTAGTTQSITSGLPFKGIDLASIALGLPISSIAALQSKNNTKLLASTQIHAFNNEDSSARIGQRVPVRTATFQTGATNTVGGVVSDVINYEQVGLTLKFKPIVFPNHDVQVAMEIESKDVAGAGTLTPTFTERTIKGTARVQNNKTLLLASVAQDIETNGRQGLPLLGLIPILGRLFTAPTKDNRQVDIVIAITPKVIRAPAILPEDEIERATGSQATPTTGSLEAMIIQEERDEMLAAARRVPNVAQIQLPDQPAEAPTYVRTESRSAASTTGPNGSGTASAAAPPPAAVADELNLKPIDSSVKTLQIDRTSDTTVTEAPPTTPTLKPVNESVQSAEPAGPSAELLLPASLPELKAGEKTKIAVSVKSSAAFRSAVLGLRFDEKKLAVRSVAFGEIFGMKLANTNAPPFLNANGRMFVSLSLPEGAIATTTGVLAIVEVEALRDGPVQLSLERDVLNMLTADGRNFAVRY
jgi:general secretion pathway protein D